MRYNKLKILVIIMLFLTIGCDSDFEGLNTNPNDPLRVPSHLFVTNAVRAAQNTSYSTLVGGDMGSCWSQQISKVQYNNEALYSPKQESLATIWDSYSTVVISDAVAMQKAAIVEENKNMQGIALTLQAYGFAVMTDVYGDVPFTEAIKGDEHLINPKYDQQQDIYPMIHAMLDDAIALLDTDGDIEATSDILYAGDAAKWKKFASSLKFRTLMRVSSKIDVRSQLQALVAAGNLFSSNDDEAKLTYLIAEPSANPIYETIVFGTRGEWKVNAVMVDLLKSDDDPRLSSYVQKNDTGEYRGKPSGYRSVPNSLYNYANVSPVGLFYLKPTAPGFFISNAELKFLMAEAVTKKYITGTANDYYKEGIKASLDFNKVCVDADCDEFKAIESATITTFLAKKTLSTIKEDALEQIATQNWIALFWQGIESWTEWRRTGFPVLTPAIEGFLTEIPSRYTYPSNEIYTNKTNYNAAVSVQGADKLTTKIWWMK